MNKTLITCKEDWKKFKEANQLGSNVTYHNVAPAQYPYWLIYNYTPGRNVSDWEDIMYIPAYALDVDIVYRLEELNEMFRAKAPHSIVFHSDFSGYIQDYKDEYISLGEINDSNFNNKNELYTLLRTIESKYRKYKENSTE